LQISEGRFQFFLEQKYRVFQSTVVPLSAISFVPNTGTKGCNYYRGYFTTFCFS